MKIFLSHGASAFGKEGSLFGLSWRFEVLSGNGTLRGDKRDILGDYRFFSLDLDAWKRLEWSNKLELLVSKLGEGDKSNVWLGEKNRFSIFLIKWISYQYTA